MPVQQIKVHCDEAELVLFRTQFTTMKSDAFRDYGHLTKLTIYVTCLEKLQANSFIGLNTLTSLEFSEGSKLTHIESRAFEGLHMLNILEFNETEIQFQNISEDAFNGLDKLETLSFFFKYIDAPTLAILPEKFIFARLPNLITLSLSCLEISCIYGDFFLGLANLKHLELYGNVFTTIELNAFRGLDKLEKFSSDCGSLDTINFGCFEKLPQLKALSLDSNGGINKLINKSSSVGDFAMLESINLEGNALSVLEVGSFSNMSNLTTLILSENSLSHLDSDLFKPLVRLTKLSLDRNKLTNIHADTFKWLSSLESLMLSCNRISCIEPCVFASLANLNELYLDNNKLTKLLAGTFTGLSNLKTLHLAQNPITFIETGSIDNELLLGSFIKYIYNKK